MSGASNGQVCMYVGHRLTVSRTVSILNYSLVIYIPLVTSLLCLLQQVSCLVVFGGILLLVVLRVLCVATCLALFCPVTHPFLHLLTLRLSFLLGHFLYLWSYLHLLQLLLLNRICSPSHPVAIRFESNGCSSYSHCLQLSLLRQLAKDA